MTAIVEVSGNRLVCIVACDSVTALAKPSPQTSSRPPTTNYRQTAFVRNINFSFVVSGSERTFSFRISGERIPDGLVQTDSESDDPEDWFKIHANNQGNEELQKKKVNKKLSLFKN